MKKCLGTALQFFTKKGKYGTYHNPHVVEIQNCRKKRAGGMRSSSTVASVLSWRYIMSKLQIF